MSDKKDYKNYVLNVQKRIDNGEKIEYLDMDKWLEAGKPNGEPEIEQEKQEENQETNGEETNDIQEAYNLYVSRIEMRITNKENEQREKDGLKALEVVPFEKWVRKQTVTKDGVEQEVMRAGDTGETKNEKFLRLAEMRMNKALDMIDLLGNLASPQYEAKPEQVKFIMTQLRHAVDKAESALTTQEKREEHKIKIPV